MLETDCIVFVSPVYWYSITAQPKLKNKKMIFITSAAAPYQELYVKFLDNVTNTYVGYVECFNGKIKNEGILAGWGMGSVYQDIKEHPVYEEAYQLGKELY